MIWYYYISNNPALLSQIALKTLQKQGVAEPETQPELEDIKHQTQSTTIGSFEIDTRANMVIGRMSHQMSGTNSRVQASVCMGIARSSPSIPLIRTHSAPYITPLCLCASASSSSLVFPRLLPLAQWRPASQTRTPTTSTAAALPASTSSALSEARPVYGHAIARSWVSIGKRVCHDLDGMGIVWTSVEPLAYAQAGEARPFCPLILCIGVKTRLALPPLRDRRRRRRAPSRASWPRPASPPPVARPTSTAPTAGFMEMASAIEYTLKPGSLQELLHNLIFTQALLTTQ
ncbi:hypothetical protein DFH27DRAFT_524132 [Peziza echinospora]|nr:hypothetical protein DFH27DRAFT_524132 [Peziza echinospora]